MHLWSTNNTIDSDTFKQSITKVTTIFTVNSEVSLMYVNHILSLQPVILWVTEIYTTSLVSTNEIYYISQVPLSTIPVPVTM